MAGEVLCPKCGTVSPTDTRVCPRCGTALGSGGEGTAKSKALNPVRPATGKPAARRPMATDPSMGATAPDDTMGEQEEKQPPRKSAPPFPPWPPPPPPSTVDPIPALAPAPGPVEET